MKKDTIGEERRYPTSELHWTPRLSGWLEEVRTPPVPARRYRPSQLARPEVRGVREEALQAIPRRMSGVASLLDAEDMVQDAFLAMLEAHGPRVTFDPNTLIRYAFWRGSDTLETAGTDALARGSLRGITRGEKDQGVDDLPATNAPLPDNLPCPRPSPEDTVIAADTLSGLLGGMDEWFRKPAKQARQKKILLLLAAGMERKEIAKIIGVRPTRAHTLITETRAACRATLGLPAYAEGTLGRRGDRYAVTSGGPLDDLVRT